MTLPALTLDIQIATPAWRKTPRLCARLRRAAQATMARLPASKRFSASATLLLTSDAKVRQLNFDFRGVDKPTNVLSFPQFSPQEIRRLKKKKKTVELGDIALAFRYTASEAKKENKRLVDHATHLVIHGLLHLMGHDHVNKMAAKRMEKTETKTMKALGLSDPYGPFKEKSKNKRLNKN